MKNALKKHVKRVKHNTGWWGEGRTVFHSLYIRNHGTPYTHESSQFYYSAIKYDPTNSDWINMVYKARIRLLDYAVEHWGDKPWEAM